MADFTPSYNAATPLEPWGPAYSQPAPTELAADDVRNRLRFRRRDQALPATAFAWRLNGGPLRQLVDAQSPNEYTDFSVGNIAGLVELCEVDGQGVPISPFASASFTTSVLAPAGLAWMGNSWSYDAAFRKNTDLSDGTSSDYLRMNALLDGGGDAWRFVAHATPGRGIDAMLTPDAINYDTNIISNELGNQPFQYGFDNEWINSYEAGLTKEQVFNKHMQRGDLIRASGKFNRTGLVGPGDMQQPALDINGNSLAYTWSEGKAYWNARLRAEGYGHYDDILFLDGCRYIGVDGAALRGFYNNTYRDHTHPSTVPATPITVPGALVLGARATALVLVASGRSVNNDLGTVAIVVEDDVVRATHQSISVAEVLLDGATDYEIQPQHDQGDVVNGTALVRLITDPNTQVAVTYSVANGYAAQTRAGFARNRAAGAVKLRYTTPNPIVAQLVQLGRWNDVAMLAGAGCGVGVGLSNARYNQLFSLAGPHGHLVTTATDGSQDFGYADGGNGGKGAINFDQGNNPTVDFLFSTPIAAPYTVIVRASNTASFRGLMSLNRNAAALICDGPGNFTLLGSAPALFGQDGYHTMTISVSTTGATLQIDENAPVSAVNSVAALQSLAQLTVGGTANADNSRSGFWGQEISNALILKGAWTGAELAQLRATL